MAKDYPPKNYDNIGDPTRTETNSTSIISAGRGSTFKQDNEGHREMIERRRPNNPKSTDKSSPEQEIKKDKEIDMDK